MKGEAEAGCWTYGGGEWHDWVEEGGVMLMHVSGNCMRTMRVALMLVCNYYIMQRPVAANHAMLYYKMVLVMLDESSGHQRCS